MRTYTVNIEEECDASTLQVPEMQILLYIQHLSPSRAHLHLRVHMHPLQNSLFAVKIKIYLLLFSQQAVHNTASLMKVSNLYVHLKSLLICI